VCRVTFAGQNAAVEASGTGQTLLEIAEAADLSPTFGCRAGSCGLCLTKLIRGSVDYVEPVARAGDGCIHLCVAVATSDVMLGPLGQAGTAEQTEAATWTEGDLHDFFD
jgi:ferredoxin